MLSSSTLIAAIALAFTFSANASPTIVPRTNNLNCYIADSEAPYIYITNDVTSNYLSFSGYHLADALKAVGSTASAGSNPAVISDYNLFDDINDTFML
jgi:hypothetical protein